MRTIYESILDNIDAQADNLGKRVEVDAWIHKCLDVCGYGGASFNDIKVDETNNGFRIYGPESWGFLKTCVVDDSFESLPMMSFVDDRKVFDSVWVTKEVDPSIIFSKCSAAATTYKWDFDGCSANYIVNLFTELRSINSSASAVINIRNIKGECNLLGLAKLLTKNFKLTLDMVDAKGQDATIPGVIISTWHTSIVAKNVTIDVDPKLYFEIDRCVNGSYTSFGLENTVVNKLMFINESQDVQSRVHMRNCRIGNLGEIMDSIIPDQHVGLFLDIDAKTKKRSGVLEKTPQLDILGREIKSGDIVLYPYFHSSSYGGNSSLKAAASRVIKVTDSMIETSGKRVYGKFCLIVPEKNDITQAHGNNLDMYGREINVGDIIAYCGSENRGNTGASVMLGEVEKIKTTIMVKNAGRRLYGADVYRVDKQWLKENDKSHKYKDLY